MLLDKIKNNLPSIFIFIGSVIIVSILHVTGAFSFIELPLYDWRFSLRGALSGAGSYAETSLPLAEKFTDLDGDFKYTPGIDEFSLSDDINNNGYWDSGLDVVLVEKDGESFKLINEPTPYSRRVYARAIKNLADAGAKVIVFDIEFDKEDHQMQNVKSFLSNDDLNKINLVHGDQEFVNAIEYAKKLGVEVVLAGTIITEENRVPPMYPLYPHSSIMNTDNPPHVGMVNVTKDSDGVHRLYPIWQRIHNDPNYYYSLAVSAVFRYLDKELPEKPKIDSDNNIISLGSLNIRCYGKQQYFLVNFQGPPSGQGDFKTFLRYPLSSILDTKDYNLGEESYDPDFDEYEYLEDSDWIDRYIDKNNIFYEKLKGSNPFRDKIVIIGTSLPEDHDFKDNPYLNYQGITYEMPGVEYHANAIQHILDENYIKYPLGKLTNDSQRIYTQIIIIIIITLVTLIAVSGVEPAIGFFIVIGELFLWFTYSIGSFFNDYIWIFKFIANQFVENKYLINIPDMGSSVLIPIVYPVASILIPYGINLTYKLITENQNKKFLKSSFGAYISPDLIDQMFEEKTEPKLGGEPGYHTMLFSDIASFSTFSEKLAPESLVDLLNEYLTAMTNILIGNKGTLDKYIGDAIVAFYGAPIKIGNHEYLACKTALEMNFEIEKLRKKWKSEGDKWPEIVHEMQHRIGINAGKIVVGNMGSEMKLNYTMTGDQVNLAARLESSAKQLGISIQVGENIYNKVKDDFIFRDLGKVIVVGRKNPINVYELIGEKNNIDDSLADMLSVFHKGLDYYHSQDWGKALELFNKSNEMEEDFPGRKTNPSKVFIERTKQYKNNPPGKNWDGVYELSHK